MSWDQEPEDDRDLVERGVHYEIRVALAAIALTLLAAAVGWIA